MEFLFKAAAAALVAAVLGLVVRQKNPELALLLSVSTVTMILLASVGFLQNLRELMDTVSSLIGRQDALVTPLIKCFAVGIVSKISAELCAETSHRAAAAAMEFAGTVCAMSLVAPLLISVLKMIGGMV